MAGAAVPRPTTRGVRLRRPPGTFRTSPPSNSPPLSLSDLPAARVARRRGCRKIHSTYLIDMENARHGQATDSQAEEEVEPAQRGEDRLHRLQGHEPAAEVHLRPRQDPRAPGH